MFDALVAQARSAVAAVTPGDLARTLDDDDLLAGVRTIERARTLLDAAEGALLAELEARGTTDRRFGLRTSGWVARTCGGPRGRITARIRVGTQLRTTLHHTEAALATGTITWDHARVLADAANPRIAEALAGPVEQELLALAGRSTFRRWSDEVRHVAELLDQDGGHDPSNDIDRNRLTLSPMADGVIELGGRLIGLQAETVRQAIERVADELAERHRRDAVATDGGVAVPPRPVLRALALVELIRRANAAGDPGVVGPSPEITLVIRGEDLTADDGVTQAFTPNGVRIPGGYMCSLSCDLVLFPVIADALGVPLDLGRTVRTATPHQRRALAVRDGGCAFPGCDAHPDRCHAHHVDHWVAELGRTDVKRMVFLCPHHHGVVHRTGWKLDLDEASWAVFTTPSGQTFAGQRHGVTRAGPAPPDVDIGVALAS